MSPEKKENGTGPTVGLPVFCVFRPVFAYDWGVASWSMETSKALEIR